MISVETAMEISGWMETGAMYWLRDTVESLPPGSLIVEIGSWRGRSTAALYTDSRLLVCVDTFKGTKGLPSGELAKEADIFTVFMDNMHKYNLHPAVIKGEANDAVHMFPDNYVDLLFLDDDHYALAERLATWIPKVKPGALTVVHDYPHFGIAQVLKLHVGDVELVANTDLCFFKKEKYNG